jgi:DNA-binding NtrC family response regulator
MSIDPSVDRLADSRATVLVVGGSEEGRAAVARALHERSQRRDEPFATIDCAGSAHGEIVRVLGSPVSQRAQRVTGRGTLYITNIEAMPLCLQPPFLRFLDNAGRPRVVVGSGIDLATAARGGSFRLDLSERLLLVRIALADRT